MKKQIPRDEFIRKRMERQRRIRKRRLVIFFIGFIILLLCVGVVLSLTVFFPIEKINISGSKVYIAEEIQKYSGVLVGDNLFTASEDRAEQMLKQKLPYIENVSFSRKLPGTLNIKVTDADEYAVYFKNNYYYTVSKSGWVLSKNAEAPQNLFTVSGIDAKLTVGREAVFNKAEDQELINKIVSALEQNNIKINKIDLSEKISISINCENRFTVNLGNANNIPEKVKHLSGMIKNIDPEKNGKINLSMWTSTNTTGTFVEENAE